VGILLLYWFQNYYAPHAIVWGHIIFGFVISYECSIAIGLLELCELKYREQEFTISKGHRDCRYA
jgi:hypothetical protein